MGHPRAAPAAGMYFRISLPRLARPKSGVHQSRSQAVTRSIGREVLALYALQRSTERRLARAEARHQIQPHTWRTAARVVSVHPDRLSLYFARLVDRLGMPEVRLHDLRHAWVSFPEDLAGRVLRRVAHGGGPIEVDVEGARSIGGVHRHRGRHAVAAGRQDGGRPGPAHEVFGGVKRSG